MTRFKDKRTAWKGAQLSTRDHITAPSDTREDLYCLTLPQSEALIAAIEFYRYTTRWLDDDTPASDAIEQFVNDTQRRLMMPCGDDNTIVLSQFTINGHYQTSNDGMTYNDKPELDPRNHVTLPPPFLPPDTITPACTYADSIVNSLINDWINHTGETEDQATVLEGIISFLAGLFGLTVAGLVVGITLAIAASIVAFTVAAWKAAYTTEVWNRLRCNLRDNIGTDGSFSQTQVDAIYSRIGDEESGIVEISLQQMIAAMGPAGLTIAARSGKGLPDADCDYCDTACDVDMWSIFNGDEDYGTIIDMGADYIIIETMPAPTTVGEDYVRMKTTGIDDCCKILTWEVVSGGTVNISVYGECGEAQTAGGALSLAPDTGTGESSANRFAFAATATTQIKVTFG